MSDNPTTPEPTPYAVEGTPNLYTGVDLDGDQLDVDADYEAGIMFSAFTKSPIVLPDDAAASAGRGHRYVTCAWVYWETVPDLIAAMTDAYVAHEMTEMQRKGEL